MLLRGQSLVFERGKKENKKHREFKRLWNLGISVNEIAKTLGYANVKSVYAIKRWLNRNGFKLKNRRSHYVKA